MNLLTLISQIYYRRWRGHLVTQLNPVQVNYCSLKNLNEPSFLRLPLSEWMKSRTIYLVCFKYLLCSLLTIERSSSICTCFNEITFRDKIVLKKCLISPWGFYCCFFWGKDNKPESGRHADLTAPLSKRGDLHGIRLNKRSFCSR